MVSREEANYRIAFIDRFKEGEGGILIRNA